MNTKSNYWLLLALFSISGVFSLTSCTDDDDDTPNTPNTPIQPAERTTIKDNNAGLIAIFNISSGETLDDNITCLVGDTLKVLINTDMDIYAAYPFVMSCENLTQINDSMFIVPDLGTTSVSADLGTTSSTIISSSIPKNITFFATYDNESNDSIIHLSATRKVSIDTKPAIVKIKYDICLSEDLKEFVDVCLQLTDTKGNTKETILSEDLWTQETYIVDIYQVGSGPTIEVLHDSKVSVSGATKIGEREVTTNPFYQLELAFNTLPMNSSLTVNYRLKTDVYALDKEQYTLYHHEDWGGSAYGVEGSSSKIITSTHRPYSTHIIPKDDVEQYLNNLISSPKQIDISVGRDGKLPSYGS